MQIAITQLTYADRADIRREAKNYIRRQGNAHLGDTPFREDLNSFFRKLRNLILGGKTLDNALDRLDLDYMNMDDM